MTRQAVYLGARSFEVRSSHPPDLATDAVLLDVAFTGLCGTDLHIYHGDMDDRVRIPAVIGHEMSGRIRSVGADVDGWSVGDLVTVMPYVSCGRCAACRAGHPNVCQRLIFLGIDADGSMQQAWAVSASALVAVTADVSAQDAALIEPTAVAVHDVRRAEVHAGEQVVVVGGGPIGLLIALVCREVGAAVTLFELDSHRRSVAESLGIVAREPSSAVLRAHRNAWPDGAAVAFEVSGAAAGVSTAVEALGVRGRLCLVAIHPTPRPVDLHRFFWRELTLVGARLYDRGDFARAVELIAAGAIPASALVSRVVPLSAVSQAFAEIQDGTAVKILIDCQAAE